MNRQVFFGREITVVLAAESRKRPEEMRSRTRVRNYGYFLGVILAMKGVVRLTMVFSYVFPFWRSRSRSPRYRGRPRSRSYSPAPRRRDDYSASPRRKETHRESPPRRQPKELDEDLKRKSYSPVSGDDAHENSDNGSVPTGGHPHLTPMDPLHAGGLPGSTQDLLQDPALGLLTTLLPVVTDRCVLCT
ncbi:hypothetical protein PR202_gb02536 [Eleusine coracana subsp. coracana]|uniref:Uncharacterized protein n=1 Tax=Eleusine coracana subsp. coracana TaxID=191504 RepID=A0AAV5DZE2_ELECO|nr:hypothetical protein PR202_gb02536 [Eleusine coracana subsp. coracana]